MGKRRICGKGLLKNNVRLSFNNYKGTIIRIFESNELASIHYNELELGDDISFSEYFKFKFCRHHYMHDLNFSSGRFKYKVCSNCNKLEYISLENDEQIQERWKTAHKNSKLDEIKVMQDEIINKEKILMEMKKEFKIEYGENVQ